jgi:hypothetical protein
MVDHQLNLQVNTLTNKCHMEDLLALVVMVVVPSNPKLLSGTLLQPRTLATASVVTNSRERASCFIDNFILR